MIVYDSPAPIGAFAAIGNRQAAAAAGGYGGGGYGGRGYGVPYDTGIQDAIQHRDQLQFAEQKQVQDSQSRYDLQRMQGEEQMAQDQQRFQLQAQLHDVELSQQERMRLQRLKNSVGEVTSDASLSDEEKKEYISQIKYHISPLQQRMAQEKLQQERIVKESMVEQHQSRSALEKQRLDIMAKSVPDRTPFVPDPTALSQVTADFTKNVGAQLQMQFGPEVAGQLISKMAMDEVLKQGLGTHAYLQPDGKLMPFDRHGGGPGAEGAGGVSPGTEKGAKAGANHPSGLGPQEYLKAHEHAWAQANKEAAQMSVDSDDPRLKKPARPELAQVDQLNKRAKDILSEMGLPRDFAEYNAQKPAQGSQTRGYQSPFASKPAAAATTLSAGSPQAAAGASTPTTPKEFVTADFDTKQAQLFELKGLGADEFNRAATMFREAKEIVAKEPDPRKRSAADQAKLEHFAKEYDALKAKGRPAVAEPNTLPSGARVPDGQPWWIQPPPAATTPKMYRGSSVASDQ